MNNSLDTILITGASRGLGANFAKVLANDGFRIIGIGRNRINLEKVISHLPNQKLNTSIESKGFFHDVRTAVF